MRNRVLITGGAGYIGVELTEYFLQMGIEVTVLDLMLYGPPVIAAHPQLLIVCGDIRDIATVRRLASNCRVVIHLANLSSDAAGGVAFDSARLINWEAFRPMLKACIGVGVERFILASSTSVYGVRDDSIADEQSPAMPTSNYARWKLKCEEELLRHREEIEAVIARPATVCGVSRRQRLDLLVNRLTTEAFFNGHLTLVGKNNIRPSVHIQDLVKAYTALALAPADSIAGEIFNIAYENRRVHETACMVLTETGRGTMSESGAGGDSRSYNINSDKIRQCIGFSPASGTRDAITALLERFRTGCCSDHRAIHYHNTLAEASYFGEPVAARG